MLRRFTISTMLATLFLPAFAGAGQIAQFTEVNQTNDFMISDTGTGGLFSGTSQVNFAFALSLGTPFGNSIRSATLTFSSTTATPAASAMGNVNDGGYSGSFTITDNLLQTILLSGTFAPSGLMHGVGGGTSATFDDSTPPSGEVVLHSAYLDFTPSTTTQGFAIALSNVTPGFNISGSDNFLATATAAGAGTFSADPLPTTITPEPVTLLLTGGAFVGLSLLLRKRTSQPVL